MTTVLSAIKNLLSARRTTHNGPDLIDRVLSGEMELQVNVAAGNGEPVANKRSTYSDGVNEWWNIRVPKNANSEPVWNDYPLNWPIDKHAEAIGSTGWDWKERVSRWVGFDFDSVVGHAAGVGVSDDALEQVRERASALPWVEVRKSTGGSGLHLYVMLDSIVTANHTEHAALARAVLSMLSTEARFDFAANVDCCGGNMWVWHRKANEQNKGFTLLKKADRSLTEADLSGWRDHVDVVTRKRSKVKISSVPDSAEPRAASLASSRKPVPLDDKHRAIIAALGETGFSTNWLPDYHLLQTHTCALQQLMDEKRAEMGLAGVFKTNSPGTNTEPNCFAFPLEGGAWKVYRFSQGIVEAGTWEQDGKDWTSCYFNQRPSLAGACKALGAAEIPDGKGFDFQTAETGIKAAEIIGQSIKLDSHLLKRPAVLRRNRDGRLTMQIERSEHDADMPGWRSDKAKKSWQRVFDVEADVQKVEETAEYVRALISPQGEHESLYTQNDRGHFNRASHSLANARLRHEGISKDSAIEMIGGAVKSPWVRVSLPFQPEYPGGRQWNLDAPQFRVAPSVHRDQPHPHWDLILNHNGQSLTPALAELEWAKVANIKTGADYLRAIFAAMIREPFEPTPYIFEWGPENSGKSILWEAADVLFTGVVRCDRILSGSDSFNGELAGALMCIVEERDIGTTPGAMNRIKDYVTSRVLSIRRMRTDSFQIPNKTHWFQFANSPEACPIWPGDTRITSIEVAPLTGKEIPKAELIEKLREEAPAFLRTLLDFTLPARSGRLRIPVVETDSKVAQQRTHSPLAEFVESCLVLDKTASVPKADVFARYQQWAISADAVPHTADGFYKYLRKSLPQITSGRETIDGARPWVFRGLKLSNESTVTHALAI